VIRAKSNQRKAPFRLPPTKQRFEFYLPCPACGCEVHSTQLVGLRAKHNDQIEYAVCPQCCSKEREPPRPLRFRIDRGPKLPFA
jgi:transcription elongation factor Elf1